MQSVGPQTVGLSKHPMFLQKAAYVLQSWAHHLQSDSPESRNVLISLLDRLFFEKWVENRVRKSEHFASPVNSTVNSTYMSFFLNLNLDLNIISLFEYLFFTV